MRSWRRKVSSVAELCEVQILTRKTNKYPRVLELVDEPVSKTGAYGVPLRVRSRGPWRVAELDAADCKSVAA